MDAEKATFEIVRMARLLGVSASGYYAWQHRRQQEPGRRQQAQDRLDREVCRVHTASHGVYGAPRVTAQLQRDGIQVNHKTVAASLRRQGLAGISPRRFTPVTTIPGVASAHVLDRVQRTWDTGTLDAVWISDITYLRTGEGWVYLCVIRDGCSRRVLGWAMAPQQTTDLVERALRMAWTLRQTSMTPTIIHTDRGSQYTSTQFHQVTEGFGLTQSMGRTGVCWDNAMAESFWSTLKTEFYDRRVWMTRWEAQRAVARWIEEVYNRSRLHTSLGMRTPVEFEEAMTSTLVNPSTLTQVA